MNSAVHNFKADLERSHKDGQAARLENVYRQFFPSLQTVLVHNADGQAQRQGIDKTVVLKNGKTLWVDEKLRYQGFHDIALEEWSDAARRVPGWVRRPLLCDYISYINLPNGKAYLLPTVQLQAAWARNCAAWKAERQPILSPNRDPRTGRIWESVSWGIEPEILYPAMGGILRTTFEPIGD